jgi:hypothetical protein
LIVCTGRDTPNHPDQQLCGGLGNVEYFPFRFSIDASERGALEEVKCAAAERWVAAVNAEGTYGTWRYAVVKKVSDVDGVIGRTVANE